MDDKTAFHSSAPVPLPITSELDLHTFQPRDVKTVVMEYLSECRAQGLLEVRIVHGKGIGALRQTVHALLAKHPDVINFALATEAFGGWGATIARLRPDSETTRPIPSNEPLAPPQ